MELVLLTALGVGGATIIGAVVGFVFRKISYTFSDIVLSFAAGVMLAAAVIGLILPSLEYGGEWGVLITVAGIFAGAVCLNLIDKIVPHLHKLAGVDDENHKNANLSKILLFVTAIAIHNLPEGIAAGVGFGSGDTSQALIIAAELPCRIFPREWSLSALCWLPAFLPSGRLCSRCLRVWLRCLAPLSAILQ